jgi:hypothetical protein
MLPYILIILSCLQYRQYGAPCVPFMPISYQFTSYM